MTFCHDEVIISSNNCTGTPAQTAASSYRKVLLNFEFKKKLAVAMLPSNRRPVVYQGLTRTYTVVYDPERWAIKAAI